MRTADSQAGLSAVVNPQSAIALEMAYESFRKAMAMHERAERLRPPGNDEALLRRWNTCVRLLERSSEQLRPREEPDYEPSLE